jgi:hypothetical protein
MNKETNRPDAKAAKEDTEEKGRRPGPAADNFSLAG